MKILITGASGFIGKHLVQCLSLDYELYLIVNSSPTFESKSIFKIDLLNDNVIETFIGNHTNLSFDAIINLASLISNKNTINDFDIIYKNIQLAKNVATLALNFNCSKLINISSTSVYPNIDGEFDELSLIDPSQNSDALYGLSKFNSEVIINKILKDSPINIIHLRISMVHGNGVDDSRIWPVMEAELLKSNTITVFGNGARLINQCSVDFVCKTINKVLNNDAQGVYNVNQETLSIFDIAQRIINEKGNSQSKINLIPTGNKYKFKVIAERIKSL